MPEAKSTATAEPASRQLAEDARHPSAYRKLFTGPSPARGGPELRRYHELPPDAARVIAERDSRRGASAATATKCVFVLDEDLPQGLAVNAASVLALTLGRRIESILGPDVPDGSGVMHIGITTIPIPILRAPAAEVKRIRLAADELDGLTIVDFSDAAQSTTTYDAYTEKIAGFHTDELEYLAVGLYGSKKPVNKLTGSLPLMR